MFAILLIIIHYIQSRIISKKIKLLKKKLALSQGWFYKNHMVLNAGKCHCLIINKDIANKSIKSGKKTLHAEAEQKLPGIIIDKDLNFQSYTKPIIKTANQKLSALIRVTPLITDLNKRVIFNSAIKR